MKWTGIYLFGYLLVMVGVFLALSKWGVLESIGRTWSTIAGLIVVGVGVMFAVAKSGRKETIEIDSK